MLYSSNKFFLIRTNQIPSTRKIMYVASYLSLKCHFSLFQTKKFLSKTIAKHCSTDTQHSIYKLITKLGSKGHSKHKYILLKQIATFNINLKEIQCTRVLFLNHLQQFKKHKLFRFFSVNVIRMEKQLKLKYILLFFYLSYVLIYKQKYFFIDSIFFILQ